MPPLFGEQTHWQEGHQKQDQYADIAEEGMEDTVGDVEAAGEAGIHRGLKAKKAEIDENHVEKKTPKGDENAKEGIGDRGGEVRPHLFLKNRQGSHGTSR